MPSLITPSSTALRIVSGELTPMMRPEKPASRKASANEPPMSPTPKMATVFIPNCDRPEPNRDRCEPNRHRPKPNRDHSEPSRDRQGAGCQVLRMISGLLSRRLYKPIHGLGNDTQLLHQFRELLRPQRLSAVA